MPKSRSKHKKSSTVSGAQLKKAQQYLGLRPRDGRSDEMHGVTLGPDKTTKVDSAAPFEAHQDVRFVTVDIEAYERDHHKITEIGIATLDTRHLRGLAPGPDGQNWAGKIRARHLRIEEYSHLANRLFVSGCADRFEFGQTQWVPLSGVRRMIASCFRDDDDDPSALEAARTDIEAEPPPPPLLPPPPISDEDAYRIGRNIVLLGHAVDNDIRYLEGLDYVMRLVQHYVEALDLGLMDREVKGLHQSRALASILYDLDIVGWNLHNAGNDAVYTLQAMLVMAVRHRVVDEEDEPPKLRMKAAVDLDEVEDDSEVDPEAWDGIPESARQGEAPGSSPAADQVRPPESPDTLSADPDSDGGVPLSPSVLQDTHYGGFGLLSDERKDDIDDAIT